MISVRIWLPAASVDFQPNSCQPASGPISAVCGQRVYVIWRPEGASPNPSLTTVQVPRIRQFLTGPRTWQIIPICWDTRLRCIVIQWRFHKVLGSRHYADVVASGDAGAGGDRKRAA